VKEQAYYAVIMAGGGGTRLWPLSRQTRPKQMLRLFDERTLFQITVERVEELFTSERILVVTVAEQAEELQRQCPQLPVENYLIEPMPRGTASVVGLAAVAIQARDPQAVMAVLTSDHYIRDEALFRQILAAAYEVAQEGYLVTLGITPTYPATGYGYVQRGKFLGNYEGFPVYRVVRFKEKPDEAAAQDMLASGDHDWNSGMFIWRVDRILDEFRQHMPALYSGLQYIAAAEGKDEEARRIQSVWKDLRSETIDYGIMEYARQVAVIPAAGLGWNDVGSWDSLFDVIPADKDGNILMGANHMGLDTNRTLVFSGDDDKLIVTIGVNDLIIVDTGDALLICDRKQSQKVRNLVNQLKSSSDQSRYI
jgi:mannose-1-phosphate guanylyltransferase